MTESTTADVFSDSHAYWNGEGGKKWVDTMDGSETNFASMSAALMAGANPKPGDQVLDVGCGGGVTSRELADRVAPDGSVLGADISEVILKVARERHGDTAGLSFRQSDAGKDDLGKNRFDLIFSRFGVMFFAEPVKAFTNLRRALKPGGRLVFLCWRSMQDNIWMVKPTAAAMALLDESKRPQPPADPHSPGPFALADADYLNEILTGAGFGDIAIEPLDSVMHLGEVANALHYLKNMGPLAPVLADMAAGEVAAIETAMIETLQPYATETTLDLPSASWIVSAKP